jgi:hypothetical protein
MPRAIDFHVHLPTTEFIQATRSPHAQAAERYFRTEVKLKDIEQIAAFIFSCFQQGELARREFSSRLSEGVVGSLAVVSVLDLLLQ